MPASLLSDLQPSQNVGGVVAEEQRALHQLALDLSMFGLSGNEDTAAEGGSTASSSSTSASYKDALKASMDSMLKRGSNMTECVPVPSSEHVAEIVGRQGCKIKALRAKTNTYIKTPVRGEEPVFVVTGRREDVQAAKREILSAAEHFSQIRASRRQNSTGSNSSGGSMGPPSPSTPGQVTIQVRVPYRVVGLVVGPKGATIKRIQQTTHTYIVTPSRDKEPVFEVTGLAENVEKARHEIETHIALRTGGILDPTTGQHGNLDTDNFPFNNDFHANGIDTSSFGPDLGCSRDLLSSLYKPPSSNSAFTTYNSLQQQQQQQQQNQQDGNVFTFPGLGNGYFNQSHLLGNEKDEGISSPTFDTSAFSSVWSTLSDVDHRKQQYDINDINQQYRKSNFEQGGQEFSDSRSKHFEDILARTMALTSGTTSTGAVFQDALRTPNGTNLDDDINRHFQGNSSSIGGSNSAFAALVSQQSYTSSGASLHSSASSSPTDASATSARRRNCIICSEQEVVAALVPCGHNVFCMTCARLLLSKQEAERRCPLCQAMPTQAIHIKIGS